MIYKKNGRNKRSPGAFLDNLFLFMNFCQAMDIKIPPEQILAISLVCPGDILSVSFSLLKQFPVQS